VTAPGDSQQELARVKARLAAAPQTASALQTTYKVTFAKGLPYQPDKADAIDRVQGSPLKLTDEELAVLRDKGFVISASKTFPDFTSSHISLYAAHLPLFVSADSILFAVHKSFDKILQTLEYQVLIPDLSKLIEDMRVRLAATSAADWGDARKDADLFLAVATGLLAGKAQSPVAGADPAQVTSLYGKVVAANGMDKVALFGVDRLIDFSQGKPRGHYADSKGLSRYFRAMMWLGRNNATSSTRTSSPTWSTTGSSRAR